MRKSIIKRMIKGTICSALALTMALTGINMPGMDNSGIPAEVEAATTKTVTASQVVSAANSKVGQAYPNNYCLRWVAEFWASFGATKSSTYCASEYASSHIQSTSMNNIPVGADVFFKNCGGTCRHCGGYAGHVGVYVGNGYFVHATGGRVQKSLVSSWSRYWRGWGYHSYINITGSSSGGTSVPSGASTSSNAVPSINSVTINSIDKNVIKFSFSVSNGSLAKIVIESTLTGHKKEASYTSGLSKISYTFDRSVFPTGGNQYRIYIYAYNGSAGNYKNEQVHKLLYGSTSNCVTFPNTLSNSQVKQMIFNYRFYADMYSDLKRYGYNEEALWSHYLHYGAEEGRIPSPVFYPSYYLKSNDVKNAYGATNYSMAYYHFINYGYAEQNRSGSPVFTASYYLSQSGNKDVADAYGKNNYYQAAVHFNQHGLYEYRNSSIFYHGSWYKANNADLKNMDSYSLIYHYICYGIKERRAGNSSRMVPAV